MSEPDKSLHVDEDWKARAQAEKAKAAAPSPPPSAAPSEPAEPEPELPPASMMLLLSMLATQAMMALGHDPRGDGKPHLAEARHFIDLLAVIEQKTKGNLDETEARSLEEILHQLRMAFVQAGKR